MILARKITLMLCGRFNALNSTKGLLLASITYIVFMVAHVLARPFKQRLVDLLELCSLFTTLIVLQSAVMWQLKDQQGSQLATTLEFVAMVLMLFVSLMALVLQVEAIMDAAADFRNFSPPRLKRTRIRQLQRYCRQLNLDAQLPTFDSAFDPTPHERATVENLEQRCTELPSRNCLGPRLGYLALVTSDEENQVFNEFLSLDDHDLNCLLHLERCKEWPHPGVIKNLNTRIMARRILDSTHVQKLDINLEEARKNAVALARHLCTVDEFEMAIKTLRTALDAALEEEDMGTWLFRLFRLQYNNSDDNDDNESGSLKHMGGTSMGPELVNASPDAKKDMSTLHQLQGNLDFRMQERSLTVPMLTANKHKVDSVYDDLIMDVFREFETYRIAVHSVRTNWGRDQILQLKSLKVGEGSSVEIVREASDASALALFGDGVALGGQGRRHSHLASCWKHAKRSPAVSAVYTGHTFQGSDFSLHPARLVLLVDGDELILRLKTKVRTVEDALHAMREHAWVQRPASSESLPLARSVALALASRISSNDPLEDDELPTTPILFGLLRACPLPHALHTTPSVRMRRRFETTIEVLISAMEAMQHHRRSMRAHTAFAVGLGAADVASMVGQNSNILSRSGEVDM